MIERRAKDAEVDGDLRAPLVSTCGAAALLFFLSLNFPESGCIDSEAENELSDTVAFYERKEPGLGLEFERAAREAVQTIQADPDRYPLQKNGARRLVMERFPSAIHYAD